MDHLLTHLLLHWLSGTAEPVARLENGHHVLQYRKPMKILAVVILLVPFVATVAAVLGPPATVAGRVAVGCLVAVFWLMCVSLLLEFYWVRIAFDGHRIDCRPPWRAPRQIPWSEVTGYDFSTVAQWHVIHTQASGNIRLPIYLSGIDTFLDEAARHIAARGATAI